MEIINRIGNLGSTHPNIILTMGNFDGVHLGHQKIVKRVISQAAQYKGTSVVLTFHPHPSKVLANGRYLQFLNTPEEKKDVLRSLGLDILLVAEFNRGFSRLTPSEFITDILHRQLKTKCLVIGPDHAFGHDRSGGIDLLREMGDLYGYEVEVVEPLRVQDTPVSSTVIRNLLSKGEVGRAADLLGRPYSVHGDLLGKQQLLMEDGPSHFYFVEVDADKLIPPDGNYRVDLRDRNGYSFYEMTLGFGLKESNMGEETKKIGINPLEESSPFFAIEGLGELEIRFKEKL